jgi:hypothetical protein
MLLVEVGIGKNRCRDNRKPAAVRMNLRWTVTAAGAPPINCRKKQHNNAAGIGQHCEIHKFSDYTHISIPKGNSA